MFGNVTRQKIEYSLDLVFWATLAFAIGCVFVDPNLEYVPMPLAIFDLVFLQGSFITRTAIYKAPEGCDWPDYCR